MERLELLHMSLGKVFQSLRAVQYGSKIMAKKYVQKILFLKQKSVELH